MGGDLGVKKGKDRAFFLPRDDGGSGSSCEGRSLPLDPMGELFIYNLLFTSIYYFLTLLLG
jgi:hypothetical protein